MAILPIIVAPDPRLKVKCARVERVDDEMRALMDDMLETMYQAPGIGLAAPQVGVPRRVIVVDVAGREEEPRPLRMANPELVSVSDETANYEEGCLSIPEYFAEVERPARVRVRFVDYEGKQQEVEAEGLLATVLQHEIDHLNGTLFIDYLSKLKRDLVVRKFAKQARLAEKDGAGRKSL